MMQAQMQLAWREVEGADCISSEDESWLNHPGFHLSDSEEDELQSVGVQYVHAVNAIKRAGLQASSQELYGRPQPLLLEAPESKVPSEGVNNDNCTDFPSATVQADQKQHTAHALEVLLPHEQATHLGAQATSTGPENPMSLQPKQLSSPGGKVADKPFSGAPPAALAQKQAQQEPLPRQSQNPATATAAAAANGAPVPLLELSLSSHQIALLQAAADNAQRYIDRDVATSGKDTKHFLDADSGPTANGAAPQPGTDWDMQSAIMAAFDTLLPADAAAKATPSAAPSAAPSASTQGDAPPADQTPISVAPVMTSQPVQGQTEMPRLQTAPATVAGATKTTTTAHEATETTAQGATKTTVSANRLNAALAVTSTAAAPSSAAAEPAAVSSQAPSGAPSSSKQIPTATTKTPMPSDKFTPQSASLTGKPTAAAQNLPGSLHPALCISGSVQPPLAIVPAPAAAVAPRAVHPYPLDPTQAVRRLGHRDQIASKVSSKGVAAPPRGRGYSIVAPAGTALAAASGTAPQLHGSISAAAAAAATPPAAAAAPPATAAGPPASAAVPSAPAAIPLVIAAAPPAAAATLPATAANPPATALKASTPLAAVLAPDKPSAGRGTAAQGLVAVPAKANSAALGNAAKGPWHSTAPSAIMVTQSFAALNPPLAVPPSRGQPPALPANLTAVPEASTAAALLPPDLSLGALPAGTPTFSWAPRGLPEGAQPWLPFNLNSSATPHAAPSTAAHVGLSRGLHPGFPQTQLVAPPPMPFAASSERPFQFPANLAPSPAPASLTPSTSQGFAGIPASPSLFSPAPAAAPAKKKPTKASKKRKAGQQANPSPAPPATGANLLPVSVNKKRKAVHQAVPSPLPSQSGAKPSPSAAASAAARAPPDVPSSNPKRHQPDPNKAPLESFDFVSPQLTAMRNAHGGCYIPMVGSHAVQPHLEDVKSLVTDSKYKYKLMDVITAIGNFAVGRKQQQDIFLGDSHSSQSHSQLVPSIGTLFGVKATKSQNAASYHEKFHLTELVKLPQAGILTRHGDMLMYYILELAELSKLKEQQGGKTYKKEYSQTLELARAVGRKLKGAEGDPNALTSHCQKRLQQLADKGYLAVKRTKSELARIRPARYPGWEGRPRYGPAICFPPPSPLPAAARATAAPHRPKPAKATPPAESKRKATPPAAKATAVPTAPPSLQISPGLQSTPSTAADMQSAAVGLLPPPSQTPTPTPQTGPLSSAAVASGLALSPPSPAQQATAAATTQLLQLNSNYIQQQQQQQPQLSGTTAALVAAVGPLFESFVAQAAAVATNPDMSLQILQGSITQELAAAIASAAMQVIEQRRLQLKPIADASLADMPLTEVAEVKAASAKTASAKAASVPTTNAPVLAGRSEPAVIGSTSVDQVSGSLSQKDPIDTCKNARSVVVNGSQEGQKLDDGVCGTDKAATHSDAVNKGNDGGHRTGMAAGSGVGVTSDIEQNRKRVGSTAKDQHSNVKRQKADVGPPPKGATTSEAQVVLLSKHATKSDTSSSGRAQRSSGGKQAQGHKGSGRGSPVSKGSKGSGKSSPQGPFGAGPQSHKPTSPQAMGRSNLGPALQNGAGATMLPSRLSGNYATGSPMLTVPLPTKFVPNAPGSLDFRPSNAYSDMMLSPQAAMANGFMPLMPSCPGDWHMQPPALNYFPMAAHFLPGVSEAPDFSPLN